MLKNKHTKKKELFISIKIITHLAKKVNTYFSIKMHLFKIISILYTKPVSTARLF